MRVGFARWRSDLASGGNRYDEELSAALRALGLDLREYAVPGAWPLPSDDDRRRLATVLNREQHWLIGNIVASAVPERIAAAVEAGHRVTILLHYFPADDPALTDADRQYLAVAEAEDRARAGVVTMRAAGQCLPYGRDDAGWPCGMQPAACPGSMRRDARELLWLAG